MHKLMTHESPAKVLSLVGLAVVSMFFMTAVSASNVTWSGNSGVAISDPFSPANVMTVVDQVAYVYSNAADKFLLTPAVQDYSFIPENLIWIKDNAQLSIAVALGLEDAMPQVAAIPGSSITGRVAGATTDATYNTMPAPYYDTIYTMMSPRQ